jgi:hypothetical protein
MVARWNEGGIIDEGICGNMNFWYEWSWREWKKRQVTTTDREVSQRCKVKSE